MGSPVPPPVPPAGNPGPAAAFEPSPGFAPPPVAAAGGLPPDAAVPAPRPRGARRKNLWRWIVRLRWPALVLALITAGAAVTYLVAPPTVAGDRAIRIDPADLAKAETVRGEPMPSLLGLTRNVAQTVLSDAGLASAEIKVVEKAAAGPAGLILDQQPTPGTAAPTQIQLTLSTPATMPNFAGTKLADARSALEQLGAVVQVTRVLDAATPQGQVVSTEPVAAQPIPTVVTLAVSDPGDALTLSTVSSVDSSSCSTTSQASVNGRSAGGSIECSASQGRTVYTEYSLARNALALDTTVGTNDRAGTGAAVITVLGDGRVLATASVGLGHSEPLHVDVRDVLRLRLEVTTDDTKNAPRVVFADAKLIGVKSGLDAIANAK